MGKNILVIGSINMDMVYRVDHIPEKGQTVLTDEFSYAAGGKGANQACAAGRLGADVKLLGCVGDDSNGRIILDGLRSSNVNVDNVGIVKDASTGTANIDVDMSGENCITVNQGANKRCDVDFLKKNDRLIVEADYILLQMEIPYESVRHAVLRGRALGKTIILNPAPAPENLDEEIIEAVDYIIPNEKELMQLTARSIRTQEETDFAATILLERGLGNLIITLGSRGSELYSDNEHIHVDAYNYGNVIDTVGAGDCYNGALATALAEEMTISEAMKFASAAAAIAISRNGAQLSLPYRNEVEELLRGKTL